MKKELTRLFKAACFLLLFGVFASPVWSVTDSHKLTLAVHPGTVVNINRTEASGSKCTVCVGEGSKMSCQPWAALAEAGKVSVTFTCTNPWDVFIVEIIKKIECKAKPCKHLVMPTDSQPLFEFNRTFHWCLRAPVRMTFHVDFSKMGLTQIAPSETCPDGHTYSLVALETTKNVQLGSFCASGTISGIQILNGGKVVLMVPGRQKLEAKDVNVFWGEDIKSLAIVNVGLPSDQSSQEFFSPDYPSSFPDDDLMTWNFNVPSGHEATVQFLDYSEPRCLKKEPGAEYKYEDLTVVRKLSDKQPTGEEGSFALSLRNCEMDVVRSRAEALGLTLHFRVSSIRTGSEETCIVDLSKESSLSVHIAKKGTDSSCKLKLDSISVESIIVPPGKKSILSFRDCPEEDLLLTINKTIGCQQLRDCPSRPVPLIVPSLERCLPQSLNTVHWNLQAPEHGAVELWAYVGNLQQSLPGQECNSSVQFSVAKSDGTAIGQFCPGGIISEVQVHGNITVSASPGNDLFLRRTFQTFFKVSFAKEITETYIFHIAPMKDVTSVLASPGWPGGMKPYSTASWIATVPATLEVHLSFTKVSQPKCSVRHTSIQVQTLGSREEMYSRREDEVGDSEIVIPESFYLNMSNCLPEKNSFSVMAEITPMKPRRLLLIIIVAVVGVLLMGMIIALVAVCVVIRKKKKQLAQQVSIYNPNGHSFLPGLHGLPKTVDNDDDVHIYDYIEDTLVYGHLLRDESKMDEYGKPAVDTYQPFNGPTDTMPLKDPEPLSGEPNGDADTEVGVYRPFVPPAETAAPASRPAAAQEGTDSQLGERLMEKELYSSGGGEGGSDAPLSPCSEVLGPWI
ncbi:CUB domain-containing protein 1a isoform X1 [Alosa sapidissima]|uniref:CUB domain-containing protein 1a isoform X1 n=2 Tax=Alosa sapidissima TaxID=34773 RepID=UPI001C082376|nr:CUB domain-containing protein 1a isoform X1 [Alosa sapidissima]